MPSDSSFLGTGWGFPPSFSAQGSEVTLVSGAEDVFQSLRILFGTSLGERVMSDDYGCDLASKLFEEISQGLINELTALITDAVLSYEPRIDLDELNINESEEEPGLLLINVRYTIRATNSRYNMVYPFYLNEAASQV